MPVMVRGLLPAVEKKFALTVRGPVRYIGVPVFLLSDKLVQNAAHYINRATGLTSVAIADILRIGILMVRGIY